eukprot:TRINITY_DN294_c0_g1_i1.p1 TRINITY_DN294_c0_g1~~TRINITY_DN294_c0_g1_i1.p1  ORF type:complete len:262 (-),score=53.83 TRINITY_DN294_c0_g1_i1:924-1709(-)
MALDLDDEVLNELREYDGEIEFEDFKDNDNGLNITSNDETHVAAVHNASFKSLLLEQELLQSLSENGFEHPSPVQHQCIPVATLGRDILCQAKSGMGKTAVFVLSVLHLLSSNRRDGKISCVVLCNTRELAFQIVQDFNRFKKNILNEEGEEAIITKVFYGGTPASKDKIYLKRTTPHIVIGTPGRMKQLVEEKALNLKHVKYFIMDECDQLLEGQKMRFQVQKVFLATPANKQVMMFSATLSETILPVCRRYLNNVSRQF